MLISDQPVGSGTILTLQSEKHTGKVTTQVANGDSEKHPSKPWFKAFVVMILMCFVGVVYLHLEKKSE